MSRLLPHGRIASRLQSGAVRLTQAALDRPGRCIACIALVSLLVGSGLARLELRSDGASLYPRDEPTVQRTVEDRRDFIEDQSVLVLMVSRPGAPAVTSLTGLRRLAGLHQSVSAIEGVDGRRVRSLASLLDARPGESLLFAKPFLEQLPEDETSCRRLVAEMRSAPLVEGLFLSRDGRLTTLSVPVHSGVPRAEVVDALEQLMLADHDPDYELLLGGPVAAEVQLGRAVIDDLTWLTPLMLVVIALLLALSLRCLGGVVVPLIEVLVVLLWTLGAMGWLGVPITLVTTILPVLLLAVTITDEIHLLDRFNAHRGAADLPRDKALQAAVHEVGLPIVVTSLTTAVGFLSFASAGTAALVSFGIFAALGVLVAMLLTFSLVPALVMLLPRHWLIPHRARRIGDRTPSTRRSGVPRRCFSWLAVALLALCLPGVSQLSIQDSWIDNFAPAADIRRAEQLFNQEFWGSYRYDIVLTHDDAAFFQRAEGLALVERLVPLLEQQPSVGRVVSPLIAYNYHAFLDGLNGPVPGLPAETIRRLSGDLQKIQNRIDFNHVMRGDGRSVRLRAHVADADFERTRQLEAHVARVLPEVLQGSGVRFHVSGELAASQAAVRHIVEDMLGSLAWTIAGIALLLMLVFGGLSSALLSMAPLLCCLGAVLGAMGWLGVPLGVASSMFAAVTLGVAVDFGIHFTYAFDRRRETGLSASARLDAVLAAEGRAIRWNTLVLSVGFAVLMLSGMRPNRVLGALLAGALVSCYLATWLVLPALLARHEDSNPAPPRR